MSAIPCLHLPIDFERRASVRLLVRKVWELPGGNQPEAAKVTCFALRIWLDWASARQELRPFLRPHPDIANMDWSTEDLTYVLESAADWPGRPGDLIRAALAAGFIAIGVRGNNCGLLLDGFWELNQHLSPDFRSIQSRGGRARAENRYAAESADQADQRKRIFDQQGILPFGKEEPSEEEQKLCYALFFRLHRVCNLDVPKAADFAAETMVDALKVIRKHTPDEIALVENYLIENRDNPAVVKVPVTILKNFADYLDAADHR